MHYCRFGTSGKKPLFPVIPASLSLHGNMEEEDGEGPLLHQPQKRHFDSSANHVPPQSQQQLEQQEQGTSSLSSSSPQTPWCNTPWYRPKEDGTILRKSGSCAANVSGATSAPPQREIARVEKENSGSKQVVDGADEVLLGFGSPSVLESGGKGKNGRGLPMDSDISHPFNETLRRSVLKSSKKVSRDTWSALTSAPADNSSRRVCAPLDGSFLGELKNNKKRRNCGQCGFPFGPSKISSTMESTANFPPSSSPVGKVALDRRKCNATEVSSCRASSFSRILPRWKTSRKKWVVVTPVVHYIELDAMMGEGKQPQSINELEKENTASIGSEKSTAHNHLIPCRRPFPTVDLSSGKSRTTMSTGMFASSIPCSDNGDVKRKLKSVQPASSLFHTDSSFSTAPSACSSLSLVSSTTPTYHDVMREQRLSLATLLELSEAFGHFFCCFPDMRTVKAYAQSVDRACTSLSTDNLKLDNSNVHPRRETASSSKKVKYHLATESPADSINALVSEGILVESSADNFYCAHMRAIEQMELPPHLAALLSDSPTSSSSSSSSAPSTSATSSLCSVSSTHSHHDNRSGVRKKSNLNSSKVVHPPPPMCTPTLSTVVKETVHNQYSSPSSFSSSSLEVQRLRELQSWRFAAFRRAEASLNRYQLPENVHAVTRMELKHPIGLVLVMKEHGGGITKKEEIVESWEKFSKGLHWDAEEPASRRKKSPKASQGAKGPPAPAEEDKDSEEEWKHKMEIAKATIIAAFTQQNPSETSAAMRSLAAMGLVTPFLIKPLSTIYGTCIPRRDKALGQRVSPPNFIHYRDGYSSTGELAPSSLTTTCVNVRTDNLPEQEAISHSSPRGGTPISSNNNRHRAFGVVNLPLSSSPNASSFRKIAVAPHPRSSASAITCPSPETGSDEEKKPPCTSLPSFPRFSTCLTILVEHCKISRSLGISHVATKTAPSSKKRKLHKSLPHRGVEESEHGSLTAANASSMSSMKKKVKQCRSSTMENYCCIPELEVEEGGKVFSTLPRMYCLIANGISIK